MARDEDESRPRPSLMRHEIGQDLATLSVEDLDERMALLRSEIDRLAAARERKEASRRSADAVFKR